jgi:phosphatidylinositol alpha 1,6-mannosyltransferase
MQQPLRYGLVETILDSEQLGTQPDLDSAALMAALTPEVKRVALLTEAFLPKVDGVTRTALLTIKYLESTGREVIVFAPSPALPSISRTRIIGIPSLWLPMYAETRVAPPYPPMLRQLRDFQPDLIHLFSPFGLGMMGMFAGEHLNVPVIANYQTDLPAYTRTYGFGFLHNLFVGVLRFIHNGSTLTLAPSQATLRELQSWGFKRLRLWERGIDTQRFSPKRRSDIWRSKLLAGRDPSRMLVLYVGRMAKEKHLETLIDIARDPSLALTLVGGGNYMEEAQQALAGTDAHFTGYLIGNDLAAAYAAADVFVFPGPEETFGQVVLEAMASGLPAVVADRGGPATLVKDGVNGFICPTDDSAAFAERARQLARDPARRRSMSAAARKFAEQRPWLSIMRQMESYYGEAVRLHQRMNHQRIITQQGKP